MTASSTSLAGSRRTTRRSRPSSPRTTNGKPPRRAACRRAPRAARPRRPSSLDSARRRRANPANEPPPANARPRHPPPSRTTICSVPSETTTRGWWTRNLRRSGRCRRREISRRRIPGTSPRFISTRRAREPTRELASSAALAEEEFLASIGNLAAGSRTRHPRRTRPRGVPRGSRVVRLLRASRGTRSHAGAIAPRVRSHPRRRRRRHASNGEVREPRQPRTRARVGGSGVGSRGHHNHREGSSARGGSKPRVPARESPRGDDSRERFGKGRERREPRRRREIRRRRGKKRSRIFVRGGSEDPVPSPAAMARPANVGFGGFTTGNGAAVTVSEDAVRRARRLFGDDSAEKTPRTETPGGSGLDARTAKTAAARGDFADDTAEKRERRSSDPYARARTPPAGGVFATGSGKPVAVSEAAMRRARARCSASRAKTRGRRRARLPGWRRRRRRRAKFVLLLPAYPVRPARHQGLQARSRL